MEILLTGNTTLVTEKWIKTAFPQDHVLCTVPENQKRRPGTRRIVLDGGQRLEQLVEAYAFDRILYFSEGLLPHSGQTGDLEQLRRVLQANRELPVQLLYLAGPEAVLTPSDGKTVLAQAAEQLCRHYAQNSGLQIKILRLPYLYAPGCSLPGGGLDKLFAQLRQGELPLDGQPAQPVFVLCMEDLAELVARVFDRWTPEPEVLTVPPGPAFSCERLAQALHQCAPESKVRYGSAPVRRYPPDDGLIRQRYGWFAHFSLLDDLPALWQTWQAAHPQPKNGLMQRWPLLKRGGILTEVLAAWLGTEALVRLTATQAQFRMVDLRLLFVVLVSTVHGLNLGVLAALLAAGSLVLGYMRQGIAPILLFYEPSYWLAFLVYFVVGAVCGYVQLRSADAVRFAQEECRTLHRRMVFVQQLCQDALQEKHALARQLLARKDSFGKLYAVTRQLDAAQSKVLYRCAVQVLEDCLKNQSIALYVLEEDGLSAHLAAASPALAAHTAPVLPDKVLHALRPVLTQGELWVNRSLLPDLPMYAAAARCSGQPVLLLLLWEAREDQMDLYEQNMFRILSGLIEQALRHTRQEAAV